MTNKLTFRQVTTENHTPQDAALLADLGRRAFAGAFGADNTPEDMAAYLNSAFSEEIQTQELAQDRCIYIVAESENNEPIGFSRLQGGSTETCITGERPVELVRFYMLPEWIGKGTGSQLMQETLNVARGRGYDVVWLGVWQKNARAIAFYEKWGFSIAGTHIFQLGSDPQTDWIMQQKLE